MRLKLGIILTLIEKIAGMDVATSIVSKMDTRYIKVMSRHGRSWGFQVFNAASEVLKKLPASWLEGMSDAEIDPDHHQPIVPEVVDYSRRLSPDGELMRKRADLEHQQWLDELAKKSRAQEKWYEEGLVTGSD